ncbi:MAG: MarR family winged helix-turn-helix transcriptional regulator [Nocardioidaceae bacterium]
MTAMETQAWGRVVALHAWVEGKLAQALQRRHDIGLSEYRALRQLAAADDGELRMQELAELIGLNQSSVSRLVLRLESAGLTRRAHCPDDRRGVYTVITDEGRARLSSADPTYEETLRDSLDQAATNRQFGDLVAVLRS